nr:hypothetical protein CFP56_52205 [Quercus suber]
MGQAISSILESFDNQEEKKKEANDALNALMTMAEDKAKLHYQEVISSALDAKKVPVRKVIVRLSNIHCGVSKNADGLKDTLSGTIRNFVKGEIASPLLVHLTNCETSS